MMMMISVGTRSSYSVGLHPNRIFEQQNLLNERIRLTAHRQETTVRDLLVLYDRENRHMGSVNVSSVLVNLAHLARRRGQLATARHERFFDHLTRRTFDLLPEMSPASLADVALAFSVLAVTERDLLERLWEEVLPKIEATASAPSASAASEAGASSPQAHSSSSNSDSSVAEALLNHFGPKDLSKLADALLNFHHLLSATTSEGEGSVHANPLFLPPTPAGVAGGSGVVVPLGRVLPLLSKATVANVASFTPQQLVNISRCLAQLGGGGDQQQQKALFEAVEGAAVPKISRFSPGQMESLVWCFAKAQRPTSTLLQAVTHQAGLLRVTFDNIAPQ